jgi:hypothetical protein
VRENIVDMVMEMTFSINKYSQGFYLFIIIIIIIIIIGTGPWAQIQKHKRFILTFGKVRALVTPLIQPSGFLATLYTSTTFSAALCIMNALQSGLHLINLA